MPNPPDRVTSWLSIPKIWLPVGLLIVAFSLGRLFSFSTTDEKKDQQHHEQFQRNYQIYSLNLPENLRFAEEKVPLEKIDLRERFDRELLVNTYWQSQTLLFIKRANKWFPVIEPILAQNGVPDDFKYLSLIESGFQNVVSPAGAVGFWQFMKAAGRENDLEINEEVDERYHLEKATLAACQYLTKAKEKFGSWTLAAASYNMGMPGLQKQLNRQQVNNYYDLLLGTETSRYLFRILAVKEILSNPNKYGFQFRSKDLYVPIATHKITVDTAISDLALFARQQGINYKVLKLLNPWLRRTYLNNRSGKTYEIHLPQPGFAEQLMVEPVEWPEPTAEPDTASNQKKKGP
ncbi:MAG: transglycosylase SLT domain-containing protein [Salibacteraceae bacterium]